MLEQNTKRKGNKAEAVVLAEFIKYGIPTLLPFGDNEKYDLVIELNGEFKSVQVKLGRIINGCVVATLKHKIGTKRLKYETYFGKVDYVAIWCEENNKVYLLNLNEYGNKTDARLRIDSPKKNSCIGKINIAKKFEISVTLGFENYIEPIFTVKKIKNVKLTDKQKKYSLNQRKVERPLYKELLKEIKEFGYLGTGRKYGVSDNTIRKWKKFYEKENIL